MKQDRGNTDYVFFNGSKKIYVCLNHRVAYLCWANARKKKLIKENALLFHIDHHADFWLDDEELVEEQDKIDADDQEGMKQFIRTKLNVLNTEFIVLSMYRGTIGDAISIHRKEDRLYGNLTEGNYSTTDRYYFEDRKGKGHNFYLGGSSIMELVGNYGLLTDHFKHQDIQSVFNAGVRDHNAVLDIDLDYFTYRDDEGKDWAMNRRHLERILRSAAMNYLLSRINVITLALEPNCCGAENTECVSLLDMLNSLVFRKANVDIKEKVVRQFELQ